MDSERLAIRMDVKVLASLGWPLTESEVIDRFVGVSDADFQAAVEKQLGRSLAENWEEEFQPLYREMYERNLRPVPGIIEALGQLKCQTCVASSGSHDKMRLTLGLTGLAERFHGRIFSATEVARGKPAPDLFLYAASMMGVEPDRCVVVEDSAPGAAAGRAAGMRVLAFAGGVTPASKLAGPRTTVFHDMLDLPQLIEGLTS